MHLCVAAYGILFFQYLYIFTGKYYAVEDMLTQLPAEKYGTITLRQHYERILREGQEHDPYTTMLATGPKKALP